MFDRQDWLKMRVAATPEARALITADRNWSWRELDREVDIQSTEFARVGVRESTRVAGLLQNSSEFACTLFALARLGAIFVPLNTRLTPGELAAQLARSGSQYLAFSDATASLALEASKVAPGVKGVAVPLVDSGSPKVPAHGYPLDAVQSIIFTSGTSGQAKGAQLTFGNLFASAFGSAAHLGSLPDDRWLACLPLYHVGGMSILWRACLYGFGVVVLNGFNEKEVLRAIEEQGVSMISLVPTMLQRLLDWPDGAAALARLRLILLGGAAAKPELLARAREARLAVATTYGLTEAASQVATARLADLAIAPETVGRALPGVRIRVVLKDDEIAPVGTVGEIQVSGPTVMAGYDNLPEATAAAIQDGWLHTGDLGWMDECGFLYVVQRRSDLILSGGENIYPAEVEAVLEEHPDVLAACVVGLPDAMWGQRVAAAVVPRPGSALEQDDLDAHCRARLAGFKIPRQYEIVDTLPQTASGKVQRNEVAKQLQLLADAARQV